jgi:hypothetical protein
LEDLDIDGRIFKRNSIKGDECVGMVADEGPVALSCGCASESSGSAKGGSLVVKALL